MDEAEQHPVSPQNPCPFLRALVAQGSLDDGYDPLPHLTRTICAIARKGEGEPRLPYLPVFLIALIANGLWPLQLARTVLNGVHLAGLRGGPLDKKGAGSGILDAHGVVQDSELDRMASFGSEQIGRDGTAEIGLTSAEITRFMDANFERARGQRRLIDRRLMEGEWPVLLKVMGREGREARYLSMTEVRALWIDRRLPARMMRSAG
jgi:hypothetical protein